MNDEKVHEILKRVAKILNRGYRRFHYKKLEIFIEYFSDFSEERIEEFIKKFKSSVYPTRQNFRLEHIVRDDLINELSIPHTVKKGNRNGFYNIQVMEVGDG